ncbi:hypothetical protein DKX38_020137 [Salix brachista]|uniref:Ribosomal protein S16 n=4 Tax=Salix TaxID=40685 RepID=A0A5N5KIH6_9ROSI|nr:hypothetical protein DKX38_020137 [Salix brachista]
MAVKIRLARLGCKNRAFYRIVAADSHTPRDGKHLQVLGFYDPLAAKGDARRLGLNVDLVKYWLSVGAQPTDTVRGILMRAGLVNPPPMVVMGQKKGPSGDTSNPENLITQFLYEKPVVSITEHSDVTRAPATHKAENVISCMFGRSSSSRTTSLYTSMNGHNRHNIRDSLLHGLDEMAFTLILKPCLCTFGLRFMGGLLNYFGLVRVKKQEIGCGTIWCHEHSIQLKACHKDIKINYDVNVFFSWPLLQHEPLPLLRGAYKCRKYNGQEVVQVFYLVDPSHGAALRESLSLHLSLVTPFTFRGSEKWQHSLSGIRAWTLHSCEGWSTAPTTIGGYRDA